MIRLTTKQTKKTDKTNRHTLNRIVLFSSLLVVELINNQIKIGPYNPIKNLDLMILYYSISKVSNRKTARKISSHAEAQPIEPKFHG